MPPAPSGVVDLSLPGYAALCSAAGVDPDAEARRLTSGRPEDIRNAAKAFSQGGSELDTAWTQSMGAQRRIGAGFTNDGAEVLDRATHVANLPAGFRDAGTQLADAGRRLSTIADELVTRTGEATTTVNGLHQQLRTAAAAWAAKVAAAGTAGGLIPVEQVPALMAERDRIAQSMVQLVAQAGTSVRGSVGGYEQVLHSGIRLFADQGHVRPEELEQMAAPPPPAGADPNAPGYVDPAGLGTPLTAGYAADPVNTAIGNFVEQETDLVVAGLPAALTFTRVYNSRSASAGGFGPRWSSWVTTRLVITPAGARFEGPDGQQVTFPRDGAGFGRAVGIDAEVERTGEGLSLLWFDGRRWDFTPAGLPRRVSAGPGTLVEFEHDTDGRLLEMRHSAGRRVELHWQDDRVQALVSSDGRRVDYRYDERGHLVEATGMAGARRYGIDAAGLVASVTDADGVVELVNTYDPYGRVLTQLSPFGRRTTFSYLPDNVTETSDDTGGPTNTYLHDEAGRLVGAVDGHGHAFRKRYDERGNPVETTDRTGAVVHQEFDDRNRLVRRTPPLGAANAFEYDEADRLVTVTVGESARTRYRYEGAERIPSEIVDPEGGVTALRVAGGLVHEVTDPDGISVRLGYDSDGNLVEAADADGAVARIERNAAGLPVAATSPTGRRTTYGYDHRGLLTERRDPDGAIWRFEYSASGRPTAVVDPLGHRSESRYGEHGEVAELVDALGTVTALRHDTFGNLAAVTAPDGAKRTFVHDALSRLAAWTDPAGGTWLREYDAEGRLTGSVDPMGVRAVAVHDVAGRVTMLDDGLTSSTFDYDEFGRVTAHVRPDGTALRATYDRCGRIRTETGPDGGVTRYTYSPAGRLLRVVAPSGRVQSVTYDRCGRLYERVDGTGQRWTHRYDFDGALVEQVSPGGSVETFAYDPCGRLARRTSPATGVTSYERDAAGRVVAVTERGGTRRFTRDAAGRVVAATDPLGHTTTYAYDAAGRLVAAVDPLGGRSTWTHDENGRVVTAADPLGNTSTYAYDAAGRLRERTDPTGARVRWEHDRSGRVSAVHAGSVITIERDALGRPVRITEPDRPEARLRWDRAGRLVERASGELTTGWDYDADGLRSALVHPDGTRLRYDRDAAGRTVALDHPLLGRIEIDRDPDGRPVDIRAAGMRTTRRYEAGLLTGHEVEHGGMHRVTRLIRDAAGRVTSVDEDGDVRRFGYDAAGQLVAATGPDGDRAYTYDACGRLVRETGPADRTYTYDAAGRLVTAGEERFVHDAAGRRTRQSGPNGERRYRWDALDRLTAVDDTPLQVDALGELVGIDDDPVLWDSADPLGGPVWFGGSAVVGQGTPWARPDRADPWLAPDWQSSVGGPTADPWGGAGGGTGLGYRGELTVEGLVWLRNRAYDPATRAFLSPDPLPPVPGTAYAGNTYHYAGNDPLNLLDPLGLRPMTDADAQSQREGGGLFSKIGNWFSENKEYIAAGALAAGGVALMFTGVGGAAGVGLMAASGAMLSAAGSTAIQKATTGAVNWNQVGTDALIGAASGGVGGAAGAGAARLASMAGAPAMLGGAASGTAGELASGMTSRGLSGGNPFDAQGMATDLLIGGGTGAVAGQLGGAATDAAPGSPQGPGVTTVYRVESPSNARLDVSPTGDVSIKGKHMLFLNFGDEARAQQFLDQRLSQGFSETVVKSFDVPNSYVESLRARAVPESMARTPGASVIHVDTTKTDSSYGLRSTEFPALRESIIRGSGR